MLFRGVKGKDKMKRQYTFELKRIFPDYKVRTPKDLEKRMDE